MENTELENTELIEGEGFVFEPDTAPCVQEFINKTFYHIYRKRKAEEQLFKNSSQTRSAVPKISTQDVQKKQEFEIDSLIFKRSRRLLRKRILLEQKPDPNLQAFT